MAKIETVVCRRCFGVVEKANIDHHRIWHAEAENLERPDSEFGWWDPEGRWNRNSGSLQDDVYM